MTTLSSMHPWRVPWVREQLAALVSSVAVDADGQLVLLPPGHVQPFVPSAHAQASLAVCLAAAALGSSTSSSSSSTTTTTTTVTTSGGSGGSSSRATNTSSTSGGDGSASSDTNTSTTVSGAPQLADGLPAAAAAHLLDAVLPQLLSCRTPAPTSGGGGIGGDGGGGGISGAGGGGGLALDGTWAGELCDAAVRVAAGRVHHQQLLLSCLGTLAAGAAAGGDGGGGGSAAGAGGSGLLGGGTLGAAAAVRVLALAAEADAMRAAAVVSAPAAAAATQPRPHPTRGASQQQQRPTPPTPPIVITTTTTSTGGSNSGSFLATPAQLDESLTLALAASDAWRADLCHSIEGRLMPALLECARCQAWGAAAARVGGAVGIGAAGSVGVAVHVGSAGAEVGVCAHDRSVGVAVGVGAPAGAGSVGVGSVGVGAAGGVGVAMSFGAPGCVGASGGVGGGEGGAAHYTRACARVLGHLLLPAGGAGAPQAAVVTGEALRVMARLQPHVMRVCCAAAAAAAVATAAAAAAAAVAGITKAAAAAVAAAAGNTTAAGAAAAGAPGSGAPPPSSTSEGEAPAQRVAAAAHATWLAGLTHRDPHARARALHLLSAALACRAGPPVAGFGAPQWDAFVALYKAQEMHVLHLVEPVWSAHWPLLRSAAGGAGGAGSGGAVGGGGGGTTLRWLRVPLSRACFHMNVSVRRLGLASALGLPCEEVAATGPSALAELSALCLSLLPAFDHERLVPDPAAVGATGLGARCAAQATELQASLVVFLARVLRSHDAIGAARFLADCLAVVEDQVTRPASMALLTQALAQAAAVHCATQHGGDGASSAASAVPAAPAAAAVPAAAGASSVGGNREAEEAQAELLGALAQLLNRVASVNPLPCRQAVQAACLQLGAAALRPPATRASLTGEVAAGGMAVQAARLQLDAASLGPPTGAPEAAVEGTAGGPCMGRWEVPLALLASCVPARRVRELAEQRMLVRALEGGAGVEAAAGVPGVVPGCLPGGGAPLVAVVAPGGGPGGSGGGGAAPHVLRWAAAAISGAVSSAVSGTGSGSLGDTSSADTGSGSGARANNSGGAGSGRASGGSGALRAWVHRLMRQVDGAARDGSAAAAAPEGRF
ncbi:hypothetical protein FOA52_010724 [Chlamydomonas sp. UWO 241]|nr:hypothetical protein FOA52_010724 [Chlamydomonas sp. UWO 241]